MYETADCGLSLSVNLPFLASYKRFCIDKSFNLSITSVYPIYYWDRRYVQHVHDHPVTPRTAQRREKRRSSNLYNKTIKQMVRKKNPLHVTPMIRLSKLWWNSESCEIFWSRRSSRLNERNWKEEEKRRALSIRYRISTFSIQIYKLHTSIKTDSERRQWHLATHAQKRYIVTRNLEHSINLLAAW